MEAWTPQSSDVDWIRNMIRMTHTGSVWGVPLTQQIFRFDHDRKVLTLIVDPDGPDSQELLARTEKILTLLGWKLERGM